MLRHFWSLAVLFLLLAASTAHAQLAPTATPEAVGLSDDRLAQMSDRMRGYVEDDRVAGLMTMVYRRGEVAHVRAHGERDRQTGAPMTPNTLFRIYSMTKPITTVAALMLYEDGHFQLDDPVAEYLPAFEGVQVYDTTATDARRAAPAHDDPGPDAAHLRPHVRSFRQYTRRLDVPGGWGAQ